MNLKITLQEIMQLDELHFRIDRATMKKDWFATAKTFALSYLTIYLSMFYHHPTVFKKNNFYTELSFYHDIFL